MNCCTRSMSRLVSSSCSKITSRLPCGSLCCLGFQDHDAGQAGRAVDLAVAELRALDLAAVGAAAQLLDVLVDLPQARGADRLATGQAAAVGVHRQPTTQAGLALSQHPLLLAVGAEAVLGHVHD